MTPCDGSLAQTATVPTSGNPGMPNGLWDSGLRSQGAVFTRTFNTVGTFPYFCTPHGECCGMTGTVNVTQGTPTPTATPAPSATPTPTPGGNPSTDFNRDGKADYLLYNPGTRQTAVWFLNNNVRIGGAARSAAAGWLESNRCGRFQSRWPPRLRTLQCQYAPDCDLVSLWS